ncbi:MAG: glycosyltransferase family 25 protein [Burkholderiaceae bacterium]
MSWHGLYINLDRAPERRRRIEAELERHGLAARYERLAATDGRTLETASPRSRAEVGIFRSHRAALARAADSTPATHVIEDDVLLCDLTAPAIERTVAQGGLERFDVVFLDTFVALRPGALRAWRELFERCTGGQWPIDGVGRIRLVDLGRDYLFGATSYLVGPGGARRLLALADEELGRGPAVPFDDMIQAAARGGRLRVGCLFPFVTTVDLETAKASSAERADETPGYMRVEHLVRHSLFARRDLQGVVVPGLEAVVAPLRSRARPQTHAIDLQVMEYLCLR